MKTAPAMVLAALGLLASWPLTTAGDRAPAWLTDFAAAREQARSENRPILAVLH
jgi:hypothetical protein